MKWLTYRHPKTGELRAGFLFKQHMIDLQKSLQLYFSNQLPFCGMEIDPSLAVKNVEPVFRSSAPSETLAHIPSALIEYIAEHKKYENAVNQLSAWLEEVYEEDWQSILSECDWVISFRPELLAAPLPRPSSFRDFYAFEEHVINARKQRGLGMVEEWYKFPCFYFSNHLSIAGPEQEICFPSSSKKWDYELEVGIVIGQEGRNIQRENAFDYVFGLLILNDWSVRDIQAEEVKVGLGPAKGKDFATSMGPFIVTPEEWADRMDGEQINLVMEAYVNEKRTSYGNLNQLYFTIPALIERASQDCTLYPGDVLGTGTVGTGCLLEQGTDRWLQAGDKVKLKVECLGELVNTIKA